MILNYPSPAPNDLAFFLASSVVLTSSISIILHLIHDLYPSDNLLDRSLFLAFLRSQLI